jgi:hypothetical protein
MSARISGSSILARRYWAGPSARSTIMAAGLI